MKVAFHTLGCKVNQYETEAMARIFREHGHEIVGEREFADVYVINTCTVTAMADRKSRQYIRRMKKVNPDSIVAVTGCYVQIAPEETAGIEGVDIVTGINEKHSLPDYVEALANDRQTETVNVHEETVHVHEWKDLTEYEDLGLVTSTEGRTRAYIKIQEGCNRFCSYCVIPYARGNIRSRDLDDIVAEAKQLIEAGYRELVLTGINTALYGMEQIVPRCGMQGASLGMQGTSNDSEGAQAGSGEESDLLYGVERVIAALNALPGNFRIRLSSLEPAVVNADYVKRLLKYDRLCHHLHLSAQSGSDKILKAMNRPYTRSQYLDIVKTLREFDPLYGISTDIIVGFPGEKDADFRESLSLVEECSFCRTHAFRYSRRPKTLAASMKDQVPPAIKGARAELLQETASKESASFCEKNLGRTRIVLVEEYLPDLRMLTGYTDSYIRVYIRAGREEAEEMLNTFRQVRMTEIFREGCLGLILNKK